MATPDKIDKSPVAGEATEFEDLKKEQAVQENIAHYLPANDEEKALDKTINRKLDFTVLLVLAISFIVSLPLPPSSSPLHPNTRLLQLCGIDKTNVGFVATSSFVQDANLQPDDIPTSLSLVGLPPPSATPRSTSP